MAANVRNLRFRYTQNPFRIGWTEKFYPHAKEFLGIVNGIPWASYSGIISSYTTVEEEENENEGFKMPKGTGEMTVEEYKLIEGEAKLPTIPYKIFGGAACEVLNATFPEAAKLHSTTDPTADIDVLLAAPLFTVDSEEYDYQYPLYTPEGYSPLAEHYTTWVFDHVVEALTPLSAKFDSDEDLALPTKEDTHETSLADKEQAVGKFLVTRLYRENMIKIQITAKVGDTSDHLMEFVLTTNELIEPVDRTKSSAFQVGPFYIETMPMLLHSQIAALQGRQEVEPEIIYKLYNHYGRVMYLLKAMRWLADNAKIQRPMFFHFKELGELIAGGLFSNKAFLDVCVKLYAKVRDSNGSNKLSPSCSIKNIIQPIRPFLNPNMPPWKDVLPGLNVGGRRKTRKTKSKKSKRTRRQ